MAAASSLAALASLVVLSSLSAAAYARTYHRAFTLVLEAGRVECYFVPNVTSSHVLSATFQVLGVVGGTGGEADVQARVLDPSGELMEEFVKMQSGEFRHEANSDGDYQVIG